MTDDMRNPPATHQGASTDNGIVSRSGPAYHRLLEALEQLGSKVVRSGQKAKAQCPAHPDRNPSLSITATDGSVLLHCHAGCATDDVLDALRLTPADLYDDPKPGRINGVQAHAVYVYDDGRKVVRSAEKKFTQSGNTRTTPSALYRRDRVVSAVGQDQTVYVVEGEKDVHAIEAAGGTATCAPMGAGCWDKVDDSPLHGGKVVVVADNDPSGYRHARQVVASLDGMVQSLQVVRASHGKDAADHIAADQGLDDFVPCDLGAVLREPEENQPIPLDQTPPLPPFPTEALPDPLRSMVVAVAEFTQTDPAMAGTVGLGVLSACAAGRADVEVRGSWVEPLNLYAVVSSAPGTRKSPVFSQMTAPLVEAERQMVELWRPKELEAQTQRNVAEEAARRAQREAAANHGDAAKLAEAISASMFVEGIEVPAQPRILADDVTPEALATLLATHGGRIALMSAEGGIFDTLAGRYSSGIPNLDTFLKGWSAEPVRVDRRGAPSEYIPHAHVTMMLTIQPTVLAAIARNGAFRGRGLLARFLYALPPNNVGHRKVGTSPVALELVASYADAIRSLAVTMEQWAGDPARLVIAPDAAEEVLEFERTIEPRLATAGDLGVVADWGSKAVGQLIRVAGLLHLAGGERALQEPIGADTMRDALALVDYYVEHAKAAFIAMGTDGPTADAKVVLDHLKRQQIQEFSVRDLHVQLGTSRFPKVDDLKAALDVLEDHRWIDRRPDPERTGPGRKPSPRYTTQITESTE